jgi:hypothetical protein
MVTNTKNTMEGMASKTTTLSLGNDNTGPFGASVDAVEPVPPHHLLSTTIIIHIIIRCTMSTPRHPHNCPPPHPHNPLPLLQWIQNHFTQQLQLDIHHPDTSMAVLGQTLAGAFLPVPHRPTTTTAPPPPPTLSRTDHHHHRNHMLSMFVVTVAPPTQPHPQQHRMENLLFLLVHYWYDNATCHGCIGLRQFATMSSTIHNRTDPSTMELSRDRTPPPSSSSGCGYG